MKTETAFVAAALPSAVIDRAALSKALATVTHTIEKRAFHSLAFARFRSNGETVSIIGTDLDCQITVTIPAAIDARFDALLPAHRMNEILKKASAGEYVALTAPEFNEAGDVTAKPILDLGKSSYKVEAFELSDQTFVMLDAPAGSEFELSGKSFWNMIDGTIGAVSSEETRYYLNGIYMHAERGELIMVATDGHRLMRMIKDEFPLEFEGVIIPRKACEILHKLMKGKECPESVKITVQSGDAGRLAVSFGNVEVITKAVDGTFPDYRRVIPLHNESVGVFELQPLTAAIKDAMLIRSERSAAVRMDINEQSAILSCRDPEGNSSTAHLQCAFTGDSLEIGFNGGYLLDMLPEASPDGGNVEMYFRDMGSPVVIKGTREGWTGVQMPMRV